MIKTSAHLLSTILLSSLLSACGGGEPSEAEIIAAVETHMKDNMRTVAGVLEEDDVVINQINKVGCKQAKEQAGYHCDIKVDIDIDMPVMGKQKEKGLKSLRFVKTNEGWAASIIE